jgi:cytochrome b6-f complex iron-sulfur subunit
MDRKEFIKTCGYACLGGSAIVTLLQSCANTNYFALSTLEQNQIVLKKSEFIKIGKNKQTLRKFVLIKSDKFSFPICVYRLGSDEFSALLLQCTHKGCELQPQGDYLVCPCHGSEFTNTGEVQNPPAEQNLQNFKTTTDHENIYIHQ